MSYGHTVWSEPFKPNQCLSDNYHTCGVYSKRIYCPQRTKGRLIYSAHFCCNPFWEPSLLLTMDPLLSRSAYCPPISRGVTDGAILKHRHYVIMNIKMDPLNIGSPYCPHLDRWIYCSLTKGSPPIVL